MTAILASGHLGQSERRARLLEYLVDAETSGEGDRIKAFGIAVDVFDRDASFDPNTDSIVRAEVGRLRDGLRLFYAENDDPDLVIIDIPKGTYRPSFRAAAIPVSNASRGWRYGAAAMSLAVVALVGWLLIRPMPQGDSGSPVDVVRISVMPFDSEGDHPELDEIAFGLFSELAMDLSAYPWIAVVSPVPKDSDAAEHADFILMNGLLWKGDRLLTNTQLQSADGGHLIWTKSQSVATKVTEIEDIQSEITAGIVASIGSDRGISPDLVRLSNARNSEADLDAFLCFLGMYKYIAAPTDEEHLELRNCLEQVIVDFPGYGEAWAGLGTLYMDEARFGRNPRPRSDAWSDARAAIETGLSLAPLRAPTLQAGLILAVEAPDKDLEAAARHGRKLLELFPRHPLTLALIGSRLAEFLGRWDEGLSLVRQARQLEHNPPSVFFLTEAYHAAMGQDDAAFAAAVEPLTTPTSVPELLLHFLAASRLGQVERADHYRAALTGEGLETTNDLVRFVLNRRYHEDLEASLLAQIEAASQT